MTFYETMQYVMDERGIKPADLCERTGLYASFFSKLKSGYTKDVTWDKALLIIEALGLTPDQFRDIQLGRQVEV